MLLSSGSRACACRFQVEEAFTTLETWQEVAAGLPALVERLRALETLHLASASFAQRLEQVFIRLFLRTMDPKGILIGSERFWVVLDRVFCYRCCSLLRGVHLDFPRRPLRMPGRRACE